MSNSGEGGRGLGAVRPEEDSPLCRLGPALSPEGRSGWGPVHLSLSAAPPGGCGGDLEESGEGVWLGPPWPAVEGASDLGGAHWKEFAESLVS